MNKKTYNPDETGKKVSLTSDKIKQGQKITKIGDSSGLANTNIIEKRVNFIHSSGDTKIGKDDGSAQIIFGRDRPSSLSSGYGGKGAQHSNTIDMVVGRASSTDLKDGASVEPLFGSDAARIYISQLTDIDLNFGIVGGISGAQKARSGIGIKADGVRIIGREGIKIVTGRSYSFKNAGPDGEKNTLGGSNREPAPPIELLAGNSEQGLQGVARGEDTAVCLDELSGILEDLIGVVTNLVLLQTIYNAVNSIDQNRPWMGAIGSRTTNDFVQKLLTSLYSLRADKILWQQNYTRNSGDSYIASRNVFST
tara:strand:+ start:1233 stop:2159 length:927 start_codon:yes stop_codon:yes gene_type:complete